MCGICGFTAENIKKSDNCLIDRMSNLLSHRGPDDKGCYIDSGIALANRRLSIIDIKDGVQPIETERYVIVFNGEIYNYQELKRELEKSGYSFQTKSDTEVLLKMYERFQEKSLSYLNGMFAFAIWDKKEEELFLARDRLGIKPLYYACFNKKIIFSSEIKSILIYPGFKKELNEKVLNSYFQYRYIIGENTIFKRIYSLLPGSYLKYKQGNFRIDTYWSLPIVTDKKDYGLDYYRDKTKSLFRDSVKMRMISDVPIGAYLSGGLDSSIVTAMMASIRKDSPVETFTIGFKEKEFNEFDYARKVSQRLRTNHHEILLSAEDYFIEMERLIEYKDGPLSVPNEVPLYLMSRELKKYITVVLSGEGADELFGGYGRIFQSYLEFQKGKDENYLNFFLKKYNYVADDTLKKFLSSDILIKIKKEEYTRSIFKEYCDKTEELDIKDRPLYIFQNLHLQGLLQRVDVATMAASVEGRVPFVDHRLVEFVNEIPFKYKIRWKTEHLKNEALKKNFKIGEISENLDIPKYLLRESFKDDLPKEIIKRRKVGFPVPLDHWFQGSFQGYAKNILLDKKTLNRGIFSKNYLISEEFTRELSGINVWMMINLELFLRKYFD